MFFSISRTDSYSEAICIFGTDFLLCCLSDTLLIKSNLGDLVSNTVEYVEFCVKDDSGDDEDDDDDNTMDVSKANVSSSFVTLFASQCSFNFICMLGVICSLSHIFGVDTFE